MKYIKYRFCVAGHLFDVLLPENCDVKNLLPSFVPFGSEIQEDESPILEMKTVMQAMHYDPNSKLLSTDFGAFAYECRLLYCESDYFVEIRYCRGGGLHQLKISRDFENSSVYIDYEDTYAGAALSFFLLFAFSQRSVYYDTCVLHASVVANSEKGYAFMGKSGTGKSTHSSLWMRHIEGSSLLNDDNPAIRVCKETKKVWIWGTPWSGKTACYRNEGVRLAAVVKLEQAGFNRMRWLTEFHALLSVLPGCCSLRWDYDHYMRLCTVVEDVVKYVPAGILSCLPDRDAAKLCYEQIKIKIINEEV